MNIGFRIMKTLREAVAEMERIQIMHNTNAVRLIAESEAPIIASFFFPFLLAAHHGRCTQGTALVRWSRALLL